MPDIVSKGVRSRMMAGIRGKNTRPELAIRKGLFRLGFRYRIHSAKLPGKPDLVLAKYKAVIFVHGCFWHRHDCALFKWPSTNARFWKNKIEGNKRADQKHVTALLSSGWRVLVIWECAIKGKHKVGISETLQHTADWLKSGSRYAELCGAA